MALRSIYKKSGIVDNPVDEKMTEIKMFQKLLFAVETDQMFSKVYFIYDLQLLSQKWFWYSMVVTKLAFHTT